MSRRSGVGRIRIALNALNCLSGGGTSSFVRMLESLGRLETRDEFHVFVSRHQRDIRAAIPPGCRVHEVSVNPRNLPLRVLYEQLLVPMWALRFRIDVVYTVGNVAPLLTPCPVVVFLSNANPYSKLSLAWSRRDRRRDAMLRILGAVSVARTRRVRFVSYNCRDLLAGRLRIPMWKAAVIEHGVPRVSRPSVDAPPERPFILTVSALAPHKNLERLIEAFCLLVDRAYGGDLVIVGGPDFPAYAERLERNVRRARHSDRIRLAGVLPHESLTTLYRTADAFVLVSLEETFGLPLIEAMQHGAPVVAGRCPPGYFNPFPEICADAARYCDPLDPTDIASAIHDVVTDPEMRDTLRRRGFKRAEHFDKDTLTRELHALLREAASARPRAEVRR